MPPDVSARLLAWYDANARVLPWRTPLGQRTDAPPPDPYRVWLSEIMLQQTGTVVVAPYFARFLALWPTVTDLATADDSAVMQAWAGLGYYARARNMLAAARVVAATGWPGDEAGFRALPGVGAYTAAAIAAIAFGQRAVVVDGNVERVVARLFAVETPLPTARRTLYALADTLTPADRAGDHAQAMMDLGATVCTPRAPNCAACPVVVACAAQASGTPERFPVKAAKTARPVRVGTAYWIEVDGCVLLERRPPRGLLGGMLGLPGTPWHDAAPVSATTRIGPSIPTVRHIFTHFELRLSVAVSFPAMRPDLPGEWHDVATLTGLPTLFARAAAAVLRARADAALSPAFALETA
jgi:A/G-specific adenine glycosylase